MRAGLVLALVGAALVLAQAASANGDFASRVLPTSDVYVSPSVTPAARDELREQARQARERGRPVKVAVVTQRSELGNLGALFGDPDRYAFHLGTELKFFAGFDGTLVVAMPSGFGTYGSETDRVGEPETSSRDPDGLARSAAQAIAPLARGSGGGLGGAAIAGIAAGALGLAVVAGLLAIRARG